MITSEILGELPRPAQRERDEIRPRIADLDGDDWADADDPLTGAEKKVIEMRILAHDREPAAAIPWEQFEEGLKRRLGE